MKTITHYIAISFILLFTSVCSCKQQTSEKQANVIVLLVDDAGYADFGFNGCKDLQTPNIDALAKNGVIFTDAHVSSTVCGPSRAGLMTGRYQQRFGFECNPTDPFTGIKLNETTIADAMKQAGYTTAAFGKWHLGDEPAYRPNQRGFDYYWGFLSGGRSYFPNKKDDREGETHSIRENDQFTSFEGYLTDALGEKAADFIDKNKEKPFFIYWAPNAVHTPMEATDEDLALFENHPRQKLAAMTWALDRAVGKITTKLKDEDLLDNTLIFFVSDNGGAHNNQSSNLPFKGFKGNEYEGGHRVPFFVHWPAKIRGGNKFDGLSSSLDIFATAIDVAGNSSTPQLDGVSLLPYLTGEKQGNPHDKLFWRKDQDAAARAGDYKMIRVKNLGYRLYNLTENLQETEDLSQSDSIELERMQREMQQWESAMIPPLWTEGLAWDSVTWLIHQDLFLNREIRAKDIAAWKKLRSEN